MDLVVVFSEMHTDLRQELLANLVPLQVSLQAVCLGVGKLTMAKAFMCWTMARIKYVRNFHLALFA